MIRTREQRHKRKAHLKALKQVRYNDPVLELTKHVPSTQVWVDISGNGDFIRNPRAIA